MDPIIISDDDATVSSQSSAAQEPIASTSTKSNFPVKRKLDTKTARDDGWGDEDDDPFYESYRRKSARRKRSAKGKGKSAASARSPGKEKGAPVSDSELLELWPSYIRQRRTDFDENYSILREGGLRLPPDYSDVYFSEDEDLGGLEEKPKFDPRSIKPCQPYEDIVLRTSGGVIPAAIGQYLRDYQIQGVEFLHHLFVYQKGGILGDDMGLGKTVQVAAFLTVAFGKTGDYRDAKRMRKYRRMKDDWYPRALIVCPGSLIQNWENELSRWGWWVIGVYHGPKRDDVLAAARAGRLEVMITTYTTYKNSTEAVNRVPWDVVVADECHLIKEVTSGNTKAMNDINSLCRIGLTGTAIQNKYEELWTLLNWTNPARFGTMRDWKDQITKPLTVGQSHDATLQQLSDARKTAKKLRFHLLPQFFLRRMKSLIADQLPKKTDRVVFCPLSEIQRDAYETLLVSPLVEFLISAFVDCPCQSGRRGGNCCAKVDADGESWKMLVFPVIMALQKLSSHLHLLMPQAADRPDQLKREMQVLRNAMPDTWMKHYAGRDLLLNWANPEYCGKWKILKKLLKFWHGNGDKVLIFSHSKRLLKILQQLFNSHTTYNLSYLDGTIPMDARQPLVDDFNSDPNQFVFLITTKAGGTGLNITSANKVVIIDPHWNPAYDLQAQDRAYRIGQVRDVEVYRLISVGTVEEIVYARQIYKQQQANIGYSASNERRYFKGVQQDPDRKGEIFGIHNLLTYNGDQGMLRDIVNKTNVAEARAGVRMIDVDVEEAAKEAEDLQLVKKEEGLDDESGGLKQLAMMLTKEDNKTGTLQYRKPAKPKTDPIQAILAAEGIEYTHENSEVIGTSKIEDELSRQAQMAVGSEGEIPGLALFFDERHGTSANELELHNEYNPPEDVRRRQFCTMARSLGFPSAVEFAVAVEGMTQEQRRNCLDLFYKKRLEKLRDGAGDAELKDDDKVELETKTEDVELVSHSPLKQEDVRIKLEEAKVETVESDLKNVVKTEEKTVKPKSSMNSISIWLSDDDEIDEL
ncbi:P-loop containing nucleoside triphosphate hydrolase protein [Xylariaceae sp. FL0016]|nr:P-loop containing nucleoside triphosphate hydrolase protein [Xylariaceae sp. FL0016]